MFQKFKEAKITNWWIAPANHKFCFFNIFSFNHRKVNLVVVGFADLDKNDLCHSQNYVVKITDGGVITAKGTFYPFTEAHELYMQFLIDVNQPNTLMAYNWEFVNGPENLMVADMVTPDGIKKNVTFDFAPTSDTYVLLSGYSSQLSSNVVLAPYARRNICINFFIPEVIKMDIYSGSIAFEKESSKRLETVTAISKELSTE